VFIAFTQEETPPSLMKHEFVHVHQIRRDGVLWFYIQYVWCLVRYHFKHGKLEEAFMEENVWEDEAYALEDGLLTDAEMKECGWVGARTNRNLMLLRKNVADDTCISTQLLMGLFL
jgi:hypothetical protein